ncbi:unnamed protein product [Chrysoparadoxa australica]
MSYSSSFGAPLSTFASSRSPSVNGSENQSHSAIFQLVAPYIPHTEASQVFRQISEQLSGLRSQEGKATKEAAVLRARLEERERVVAEQQHELAEADRDSRMLRQQLEDAQARADGLMASLNQATAAASEVSILRDSLRAENEAHMAAAALADKLKKKLEETRGELSAEMTKAVKQELQRLHGLQDKRDLAVESEAAIKVKAVEAEAKRELMEMADLVKRMHQRVSELEMEKDAAVRHLEAVKATNKEAPSSKGAPGGEEQAPGGGGRRGSLDDLLSTFQ